MTPDNNYRATFIVMKDVKRNAIAQEIAVIEDRLKANEETAIAVADYLAQKQLWSDVLQQLYTVENPSPKMSKGNPRFKNECVVQTHNILSDGTWRLNF